MAFTSQINIEINSVFDDKAFKKARRAMSRVQTDMKALASQSSMLQKAFSRVSDGMDSASDGVRKKLEPIRDRLSSTRKAVSKKVSAINDRLSDIGGRAGAAKARLQSGMGAGLAAAGKKSSMARGLLGEAGIPFNKGAGTFQFGGGFKSNQEAVQQLGVNAKQAAVSGLSRARTAASNLSNTVGSRLRSAAGAAGGAIKRVGSRAAGAAGFFREGQRQGSEFSFELLGIMFAGMALQRVMTGLLRPAFKVAGVFDVISSTLEVLFLPIALDVLDWVLQMQDKIFGLDEETKNLIGRLALVASALGAVLLIGGQLGLALQSLKIFVMGLTSVLSVIGLGGFIALLGAAAAAVGMLTAEGETMSEKWKNFTDDLDEMLPELFEWTEKAAGKLVGFLSSMFSKISTWFVTTDWSKVWDNVFEVGSKLGSKIKSFMGTASDKMEKATDQQDNKKFWDSLFEFTDGMTETISDFISSTVNAMSDELNDKEIWEDMFEITNNLKAALARFAGQIVGNIVRTIMEVDWGKVFGAAFTGAEVKGKKISELSGDQKIGASFIEGIDEGLTEGTPDSPAVDASEVEPVTRPEKPTFRSRAFARNLWSQIPGANIVVNAKLIKNRDEIRVDSVETTGNNQSNGRRYTAVPGDRG